MAARPFDLADVPSSHRRPGDAPEALVRRPLPALQSRGPRVPARAGRPPATGRGPGEERPGAGRKLRRARQLPAFPRRPGAGGLGRQQPLHRSAQHRHLRRAGVRLRLWPDPHPDAGPGPVPGHRPNPDPRPFAAAGDQPDLPLRQPGAGEGAAVRPLDLRADRDRHRRGVLDLPARADHPDDGLGHVGRPALRGGLHVEGGTVPDLHDRHPAGGALWARQRRPRRLRAGHHRFRRAQGGGRALQRAGDGRVQAGGGPAELPDGGRGRPRSPAAGRAGLRRRPLRPAAPGGPALRPRSAAGAGEGPQGRRPFPPALHTGGTRHPHHHRGGGVRLARDLLALQSHAVAQELCLRHDGWRRLGKLPQLARSWRD